jgi:ATP-dependent DNA helicase RecG
MFRTTMQLKGPGTEILEDDDLSEAEIEQRARPYRPLYPASAKLSTATIERTMKIVLDSLDELADPIPAGVRKQEGLVGLREPWSRCTCRRPREDWLAGQRRLRFQEALVLQTILAQRRAVTDALKAVPRRPSVGGLLDAFDARLPFDLTAGQAAVGDEVVRRPGPAAPDAPAAAG